MVRQPGTGLSTRMPRFPPPMKQGVTATSPTQRHDAQQRKAKPLRQITKANGCGGVTYNMDECVEYCIAVHNPVSQPYARKGFHAKSCCKQHGLRRPYNWLIIIARRPSGT